MKKCVIESGKFKVAGIDIDEVITASPEFFSSLSKLWKNAGTCVHIVSSRCDIPDAKQATIEELQTLGIVYEHLYLLPSIEVAQIKCQHRELDWYQKYLWQKVDYCLKHGIEKFYDDDTKVVQLFRIFAPDIEVVHYVNCTD